MPQQQQQVAQQQQQQFFSTDFSEATVSTSTQDTPEKNQSNNCCWKRSKQRKSQKNRHETINSEEYSLIDKPTDAFHYYGIPLLSPTDYYRFINEPYCVKKHVSEANKVIEANTLLPDASQQPIKATLLATAKEPQQQQSKFSFGDVFKRNGSLLRRRKKSNSTSESDSAPKRNSGLSSSCRNQNNKYIFSSLAPSCSKTYENDAEPLFGIVTVTLWRRNGIKLGLGITGGSDRRFPPTISYLRPGFIAQRCDQLQVGDRLERVNGIRVSNLTHHEIMLLLRNAGPLVTLQVEYDLKSPFFRAANSTSWQKCAEICLENDYEAASWATQFDNQQQQQNLSLSLTSMCSGLYGMTIRGGAYGPDPAKNRPITITAIRTGGPAHREGRLRVGDRILTIGGVDVTNATLSTALKLMRESHDQLQLTLEYDASILASLRNAKGPILLEIEKVPGIDFGIVLAIRKPLLTNCSTTTTTMNKKNVRSPVIVQKRNQIVLIEEIIPASVADRCGAVNVGDELYAIDGISLEYTNLIEVYQLLRSQATILRLELLPFCISSLKNHYTDLNILKHNNDKLQLGIVPIQQAKQLINEGRLLYNSHKNADSLRNTQQWNELAITTTATTTKTYNNNNNNNNSNTIRKVQSPVYSTILKKTSQQKNSKNEIGNQNINNNINNNKNSTTITKSEQNNKFYKPTINCETTTKNYNNYGSMSAHFESNATGIPCTQVSHAETMEVTLSSLEPPIASGKSSNYDFNSYGITLQRVQPSIKTTTSNMKNFRRGPRLLNDVDVNDDIDEVYNNFDANDFSSQTLFISSIARNSPADRCGVLQVGDRIISINDWFTANGSLEEALHVLKHSEPACTLLVEFDVIESTLPTNGLFVVKLAKRGNNLGIVCKSETNCEKGEPVIISDIRTGSVAHRCGSIQIGDQVMAIDNIPLDSCSVEESMRLLQRSGNIVKLCVLKSGADESDPESQMNSVIYSIELSRKGQPLGITIASTGLSSSPVVISQLTPGGLVERTGALHIGDRILAINGETLEGKKVAQAIQLLQQSNDKVTIKVCRRIIADPLLRRSGVDHYPNSTEQAWRASTALNNHINNPLSIIQSDSASETSEKLQTPIKSVDSAVDSLEESPSDLQKHKFSHTRPSTSNYYHPDLISGGSSEQAWDSGLSSTADTNAANIASSIGGGVGGGGGEGPTSNSCCACSNTSPTKSNSSFTKNDGFQEDWIRILEALETVGEEEMLRKLEESIMSGRMAGNSAPSSRNRHHLPSTNLPCSFTPLSSSETAGGLLSKRSLQQSIISGTHHNTTTMLRDSNSTKKSQLLDFESTAHYANKNSIDYATTANYQKSPTPKTPHRTNSTYNNDQLIKTHSQQPQQHNKIIGESVVEVNPIPLIPLNLRSQLNSVITTTKLTTDGIYCSTGSQQSTLELPPPMPPTRYNNALSSSSSKIGNPHVNVVNSSSPSSSSHTLPLLLQKGSTSSIPYITTPISPSSSGTSSASPKSSRRLDEMSALATTTTSRRCGGELFSVTLKKNNIRGGGFGFSVSDGDALHPGIYVNAVIAGSPADGKVQPMDRVLQINGTSIQFLDCDLALPLLATEQVELLLMRNIP